MMITVSLTVAEFRALQRIAQMETQYFDGMEPEELLRCFVADLVQSGYSGGSDERENTGYATGSITVFKNLAKMA